MKISKLLVIAALIAPVCRADDSLSLAEKFLDLSGTQAFMQDTFESGLKPSLDQMRAKGAPSELVDSIHAEAKNFFLENFKWEDMRPQIAKLYTTAFTEAELADIIAFYQTPTGQKTLAKMPALTQQSMVLAMSGVQANMPEFQRRVGAIIQDFQKRQAQAAQTTGQAAPAPATVTVPAETPAK
jgi:uncharacterized protein